MNYQQLSPLRQFFQSGGSIVDFLKENNLGEYSSLKERKKLGKILGIEDVGTSRGNLELLSILKNQGLPTGNPGLSYAPSTSVETMIDSETGQEITINVPNPGMNIPEDITYIPIEAFRPMASNPIASRTRPSSPKSMSTRVSSTSQTPVFGRASGMGSPTIAPELNSFGMPMNGTLNVAPMDYSVLNADGTLSYPNNEQLSPWGRYKNMRESGDSPLRGTDLQGTGVDQLLQTFVTNPFGSLSAIIMKDPAVDGEDILDAATIIPILKIGRLASLGAKIPGLPNQAITGIKSAFSKMGLTQEVMSKLSNPAITNLLAKTKNFSKSQLAELVKIAKGTSTEKEFIIKATRTIEKLPNKTTNLTTSANLQRIAKNLDEMDIPKLSAAQKKKLAELARKLKKAEAEY